jgi:hypothetical protein
MALDFMLRLPISTSYIYIYIYIIEINTYIEGRVAFMLPIVFWIHIEKGKALAH